MTLAVEWKAEAGQFLETDGKLLEYACFGPTPAKAMTIVLLHEGLGCLALWRDFPKAIAEATGCGVFVYSRAGYGRSDTVILPRPLDYMTREATDVLPKILDVIGVRRTILLGHSDGATIAAIYTGSHEDHRVRGLILMAPHFFCEEMGVQEIAKAKVAFEQGDLSTRLGKYHSDPTVAFRGWSDAWLDPDFAQWDASDVIDFLRVPVFAIQGHDDQYGTIAQVDTLVDRCYAPVDVAILDDCQHAPHFDQPDVVIAKVREFVERLLKFEPQEIGDASDPV
ncbi:MAG: alpha/beta hydrolase [Paracoccaceae bacterium]|jgi:pimeloyl-ACP methyl ester carboxylesterase|nr:alpha/beta hydrolase [Paracoccaceae bacterium]